MTDIILKPVVLTSEAFAPFGDVIETSTDCTRVMNDARFDRFDDLASVDVDMSNNGHVAVSIAQSRTRVSMPYRFDLVERHPLGSQAFIPMSAFSFTVVVAPAGETIELDELRAFTTNGAQGINYHRGVWHMPLVATDIGQKFLVVDRAPGEGNYQEMILEPPVTLHA